ncbi:MAG: pyridoxamine 5'-phosphate oxidase family protein [Acidimicrobiia bacterium]|nr:pyridoxamine 5'-phosphate oxidase family protein [Acidimicrobiia bacterium]
MAVPRDHMGWGPDESLTPEELEVLIEGPGIAAVEELHVHALFEGVVDWDEPPDGAPLVDNGLQMLTESECQTLLRQASLGRVGVATAGVAMMMPVTYAMVGDDVVFRTGVGLKLDAARAGKTMTFEVDAFDPERRSGWSVLVVGTGEEIEPSDLYGRDALSLWPAAPGQRHHVVRIRTDLLTGRRFGPA